MHFSMDVYISLYLQLNRTEERNNFFFFFCMCICVTSIGVDLIDGIDMSELLCIHCAVRMSSNLSCNRSKASSMIVYIVVETSFIKLNIVHRTSDNQQKYIAHMPDIWSISSSIVVRFFFLFYRHYSCYCTLSLKHRYLNILLSFVRLIVLSYLEE